LEPVDPMTISFLVFLVFDRSFSAISSPSTAKNPVVSVQMADGQKLDVEWLRIHVALKRKKDPFLVDQLEKLEAQGVETVGDLKHTSRETLQPHLAGLVLDALKPPRNEGSTPTFTSYHE
jgi:hypothetical protein